MKCELKHEMVRQIADAMAYIVYMNIKHMRPENVYEYNMYYLCYI